MWLLNIPKQSNIFSDKNVLIKPYRVQFIVDLYMYVCMYVIALNKNIFILLDLYDSSWWHLYALRWDVWCVKGENWLFHGCIHVSLPPLGKVFLFFQHSLQLWFSLMVLHLSASQAWLSLAFKVSQDWSPAETIVPDTS